MFVPFGVGVDRGPCIVTLCNYMFLEAILPEVPKLSRLTLPPRQPSPHPMSGPEGSLSGPTGVYREGRTGTVRLSWVNVFQIRHTEFL